jgi:Putative regulatory, ligand-binding protein related to C-terminal domains of K+ channels
MYPIEETELAGIGRRFVVVTDSGNRLIIVVHDSGVVELYYASPEEPQKTCPAATLTNDEARLVAAIIGRTIYRPEAIERLSKYGVTIRWYSLKDNTNFIGKTIGELFQKTAITVLTVVEKDGKKQTSPPDNYVLQEGSQVALSGDTRSLEKIKELIDKGK